MTRGALVILVSVATFSFGLGIIVANRFGSQTPNNPNQVDQEFSSQSATIEGIIIGLSDNKITIQNRSGKTWNFSLSSSISISDPSSLRPKLATNSAQIQEMIELNRPAIFQFYLTDLGYQLTSVTYVQIINANQQSSPALTNPTTNNSTSTGRLLSF